MNPVIFDYADLPLKDLEAVGLVKKGELLLEEADLKAMFSGRRTNMLQLENLEFAGMKIAALKAKLQLVSGADGKTELRLHPAYLERQQPQYLSDTEADALEQGEAQSFEKTIVDGNGQKKRVLFEFDQETKQFLETDLDKLPAPEKVNNEPLTLEQQARYKRGEEVELKDGTRFRYTATTPEGIRANRIALIASIVFDGGISYVLFHSIKALIDQKQLAYAAGHSEGYQAALAEMKAQQTGEVAEEAPEHKLQFSGAQYEKGYARKGR